MQHFMVTMMSPVIIEMLTRIIAGYLTASNSTSGKQKRSNLDSELTFKFLIELITRSLPNTDVINNTYQNSITRSF